MSRVAAVHFHDPFIMIGAQEGLERGMCIATECMLLVCVGHAGGSSGALRASRNACCPNASTEARQLDSRDHANHGQGDPAAWYGLD